MPTMKVKDLEMYYEIHGEKNEVPLVLIMGLSGDVTGWMFQIPEFSKKYRVIAFDNRDAGRTSKTDTSYSIDTMAEDTYNLLKQLGVKKAHIFGASMGGCIAQSFALKHPEMLRSLILASTIPRAPKGVNFLNIWPEMIKLLPQELFLKQNLLWALTKESLENDALVQMGIQMMKNNPFAQPPEAFIRQCQASLKFDALERLKEIKAPTLVVVGDRDILTPVWEAKEIASRIPKAELKVIQGCAHGMTLEKSPELNKAVLEFLEKH
nr:alpha/beta hydrolase [Candidatus Freyarchaeota archaeon]